jgi:hypothetical protein
MLFDFAAKITQLSVANPSSAGGSVYAGMSVQIIPNRSGSLSSGIVAQFAQE